MTGREIAEFIERIAPHKLLTKAGPGFECGFQFGNPDTPVTGVATCWSPTTSVIEKCIGEGVNFLVAHEFLLYPRYQTDWFESVCDAGSKLPNIRRIELLLEGGICVYSTHTNWDAAPGWGIVDSFGKALGFTKQFSRGTYTRVYTIEPCTLAELAGRIKAKFGFPMIRVAGDLDRRVNRVGIAVGGLGQLWGIPEEFARLGADAVIFGEILDYTVRFALEYGMAVIETEHCLSENFGVAGLADQIRKEYPGLKVVFLDTGSPWHHV